MTSILDRVAKAETAFRPKTVEEFFALRLAQKLSDGEAAAHYALVASQYPRDSLLAAYRRALQAASLTSDLGRCFHVELARAGRGTGLPAVRLAAIKVERRSIAAAVFVGDRPDYTQVRHLSSVQQKAEASAHGFLNWIIESFGIESAALETVSGDAELRRSRLSQVLLDTVRAASIPLWQIAKHELFAAFGQSALKSRQELRQTVLSLWPVLSCRNSQAQTVDAVALGLFVQTERQFIH